MSAHKKKKKSRITRSISFESALMDYCKTQAKKLRRSVNWFVNELVRKENNAPLAAASLGGR